MTAADRRRVIRWRNRAQRLGWITLIILWAAGLWGVILTRILS